MQTVDTRDLGLKFLTPPADQGQIVEVSYAGLFDGRVLRRTHYRSDMTTEHHVATLTAADQNDSSPIGLNRAPRIRGSWKPCRIQEYMMKTFIDSADSRETSAEIMTAIAALARSEAEAVRIWEAPTLEEAVAVWERTTNNGLHNSRQHCWGTAGYDWAFALGVLDESDIDATE